MDNYKTAAELEINDLEYQALLKTIEVLEDEDRGLIFNMSSHCDRDRGGETTELRTGEEVPLCGTHCCIGGTMSLLLQCGMELPPIVTYEMSRKVAEFLDTRAIRLDSSEDYGPFNALFYDNLWSGTTPRQGINAIRQFLSGNTDNPWCGMPVPSD